MRDSKRLRGGLDPNNPARRFRLSKIDEAKSKMFLSIGSRELVIDAFGPLIIHFVSSCKATSLESLRAGLRAFA
jgi:hypothetical protein